MERELVLRVARRYASVSARMYARGKLGSDPVADQLLALGRERPLGRVIDVGCGRGQMGLLLLEAGLAESVRGFDWDEGKLADGNAAAAVFLRRKEASKHRLYFRRGKELLFHPGHADRLLFAVRDHGHLRCLVRPRWRQELARRILATDRAGSNVSDDDGNHDDRAIHQCCTVLNRGSCCTVLNRGPC